MDVRRLVHSRLALFTLLYFATFLGVAAVQRNIEFLFYTIIMLIFLFFLVVFAETIHLEPWILTFTSLFICLHLVAGNIWIGEIKLYDQFLLGNDFRMDNLVHLIGGFLASVLAYNVLEPLLGKKLKRQRAVLLITVTFISLGIGSINEIIELIGVLYFNAAPGVGDYLNNAKDQFYNFLGAVLATPLIAHDLRNKFFQQKISSKRILGSDHE